MTRHFTPEAISEALFNIDGMHTCCLENDCFDEYDRIAADIIQQLQDGLSLEEALISEITAWFAPEVAILRM